MIELTLEEFGEDIETTALYIMETLAYLHHGDTVPRSIAVCMIPKIKKHINEDVKDIYDLNLIIDMCSLWTEDWAIKFYEEDLEDIPDTKDDKVLTNEERLDLLIEKLEKEDNFKLQKACSGIYLNFNHLDMK